MIRHLAGFRVLEVGRCEQCSGPGPLYGHTFFRINGALMVERCYRALCPGCLLAAQAAEQRETVRA